MHRPGQVVEVKKAGRRGGGEEGGRYLIWCYSQVDTVPGVGPHPKGPTHPHPTTPPSASLKAITFSISGPLSAPSQLED